MIANRYFIICLLLLALNVQSQVLKYSMKETLGTQNLIPNTSFSALDLRLTKTNQWDRRTLEQKVALNLPYISPRNSIQEVIQQRVNIHMTSILGSEFRNAENEQAIRKSLELVVNDKDQRRFLEKLTAENQKEMDAHNVAKTFIDLNGEIIKASTSPVPLFGKAVGFGVDKMNNYLIKESLENVRSDLAFRLDNYQRVKGADAFSKLKESYDERNPKLFLDNLNSVAAPIEQDYLKMVPEEERDIVQHFYATQTVKLLKSGFAAFAEADKRQDLKLEDAQRNINGLARAFYTQAKNTQSALKAINLIQTEIQGDLKELKKDSENNFQFVFEFMYSKMSVAERQSAIQQGMMDRRLNDGEKEQELKKLAVLAKQQRLQAVMSSMVEDGSNVINIARNLHLVDPKILQTAGNIVSGVGIAQKVFGAITNGNYLGAISAVTDLFGLGGPDVAQQRHEEILRKFDMVFARFDGVDNKLNALLQEQEMILKNQRELQRSIIDLSMEISNNHIEVLDKLNVIHGDILINRELLLQNVLSQYASCAHFCPPEFKLDDQPIAETNKNILPSFSTFKSWWFKNKPNCIECRQRFTTIYSGDKRKFNPIFTYKNNTILEKNKAALMVQDIYKCSLDLLTVSQNPFPVKNDNLLHLSPYFPIEYFREWDAKCSMLFNAKTKGEYLLQEDLLEPNMICLHTSYLVNFHLYFLLTNPLDNDNPYDAAEFLKRKNIPSFGEVALAENLSMLNQTIAQQNLLSGDILIPIISNEFEKYRLDTVTNKKTYDQVLELIVKNSLLRKNFLVYQFEKELKAVGDKSYLSYRLAQSLGERYGELEAIHKLFRNKWNFVFAESDKKDSSGKVIQPQGLTIKLGKLFIPLPSTESLNAGKIEHTADFYQLLNLREDLKRELNGYLIYETLDKKESEVMNAILLYD